MKIAIVDDHQIIIDGIEMLLGLEKNIAIVKTYTDAFDFLQDMREEKINPDLLLMDLMMPTISGFECAKILKQEFPKLKIIILSMNCDPKVVYELVEKIKIEGYLSKNVNRQNLVRALQEVQLGYIHLSEEAEMALNQFKRKIIDYPQIILTAREKQIVKLMIDGLTNKEISNALFISESTVETHRKNIYRKTETHSFPKLIQVVANLNLLAD
ncbi:response regulator transcription factor [Soonwooa sp.]|uniref:response regulator transcription factor n=1 Tax=Soonwooa sp. TaxID=1938592 RepID=UPI0028A8BCD7|nr:response regulator transcription factor [Soonwooa sp.]